MREEGDREVLYRCTNPKCKAEDRVFAFSGSSLPAIINCWSCHAGYGMEFSQQMQMRKGMMQVEQTEPLHAQPQLAAQPA